MVLRGFIQKIFLNKKKKLKNLVVLKIFKNLCHDNNYVLYLDVLLVHYIVMIFSIELIWKLEQ